MSASASSINIPVPVETSDGGKYVTLDQAQIYSCKQCKIHLALSDDIVSKGFHCKNGKAYLFNKVVNVTVGIKEDRLMLTVLTGMHTVADISCVKCGSIVGWTYETAHEKSQKFKEGKSILELYMISGPDEIDD